LVGKWGLIVWSNDFHLTLEDKVQVIGYIIGLKHEISKDTDLGVALHGQTEDKRWVCELEKVNTLDKL
jgi:hypothetical protein